MRPGVSAVEAWNPGSLRTTADLLDDIVERLDDRLKGLLSDQDVLAEQWTGPAASAAAARIVRERSLGSAVAGALSQTADAYRAGAGIADGARMHVLAMVRNADCQGFTVHDNGIVDASGQVGLLQVLLPPGATLDHARLRLEREAAELSVVVVGALEQAGRAAVDIGVRIDSATAAMEDAAQAAKPVGAGSVRKPDDFSWQPDWAATTAASTIGIMADGTTEGLKSAAVASTDDLARNFARGLGPAGAALGVIPAIADDIDGGMDPMKAVITESTGAAVGFTAGTIAGTKIGGTLGTLVAPGVGTAVGLIAGAAVGGGVAWLSSKSLQTLWDQRIPYK